MKNKFSSICISSTSENERVQLIAMQIYEILSNKGCEVFHDLSLKRFEGTIKSKYRSEKFIIERSDLIIAIGGDGTILNCSRKYGSKGLPILGINLGKLGFLTDIAPANITNELMDVIDGNSLIDNRFFLKTILSNNSSYLALNEVVIHSGAIAQLIEFDLFIDEQFVYRQKADGIIINTPTGSTAYSLSGGGPILHPNIQVLSILPMFPQSLSTSPLVVDADSILRIELISKSNAKLSFDSHDLVEISNKVSIEISKSKDTLSLIHPVDHDFYESCRTKLGWSSNISNSKE